MSIESITLQPIFGNRCGHIRELPRFYARPEEHKKTYDIIHIAAERVQDYYWNPVENWLPNLSYARSTTRQQRSERREAIAAITSIMLNSLDLATFRIIRLFNGTPIPLSVKEIATKAGIGERRVERAIFDLKRAGYLEVNYRYESLPSGQIKPLVAIKSFSSSFFYHLGITYEKLEQVRLFAKNRLKKFNRKLQMAAAEAKSAFRGFASKLEFRPTKNYNTPKTSIDEIIRWQKLREEHPDWSPEQIKAAAKY